MTDVVHVALRRMDRRPRACDDVVMPGTADPTSDDPELPADLWERIRSAVSADSGTGGCPGSVVEYRIDADDVVIGVGADWFGFAEDNEAPELVAAPTGRSLWSSIGDASLRDLWREAVARVRSSGEEVTVPFRCDGPHVRRWFDMTVTPLDDGSVQFRSRSTFEMPRPEVVALRRDIDRDPDSALVEVCSWCGEGNDGGRWVPIEELLARARLLEQDPPPPVVHGICPRCVDRMATQLAGPGH